MGQDRENLDKTTIDNIRTETSQILQRLSALDQKTVDMKEDVTSLCQLVRDGNGQPSIAHRLTSVEEKMHSQHKWLEEVAANCTTIAAARTLSKSQVLAGLVVMMVTAVLSVIALVVG
jgi:hypothetical protein